MKSTLVQSTRDELIARIKLIEDHKTSEWGKMNIGQMIRHCILWDEMVLNNTVYKRAFLGRLFGKIALKSVLKDDKALGKNMPTIPEFVINDQAGEIDQDKSKWISLIEQYEDYKVDHFMHPFFGKMTKEQIGFAAYKHIDHHLRQFGC